MCLSYSVYANGCVQIGLDGVRMLDPSTSRTLRIYPLETITRWEVTCFLISQLDLICVCIITRAAQRHQSLECTIVCRWADVLRLEKQVYEPAIFTFWAKSAVDVEQRCIRLQSSSYTTGVILDTITAACVQVRGLWMPRCCGCLSGEIVESCLHHPFQFMYRNIGFADAKFGFENC